MATVEISETDIIYAVFAEPKDKFTSQARSSPKKKKKPQEKKCSPANLQIYF